MDNEQVCVFCGRKPGMFRSAGVVCAGVYQTACKSCEKELAGLDEVELCRRALRYGRADRPQRLEERIKVITEAENHRPKCLACGEKLTFAKVQQLDNSPYRDGILSDIFDVLPAYCPSCGRMEFYHPDIVRKNKCISYLVHKDTKQ